MVGGRIFKYQHSALVHLPWAVLVWVADQLSKWWVVQHTWPGYEAPLLSWLSIVHVHNHGAAFGVLSQAGGWQRWFFLCLACTVSVVLMGWLRRLPSKPRLGPIALCGVLGGALGNAYDRLYHGFVIDFVDIHWHAWHWPAFNLADAAICGGVVCLVWGQCRMSVGTDRRL